MTEFIRGAWTAERITLMPAAWNTESNVAVKLASRSCRTNLARVPASSRSMSKFRACCTTHDWTGRSVAPRIRMRWVPCSMPQHHRPHLAMRCRAPGAASARQARPPAADDVALPAQDRVGSDDQEDQLQAHKPKIIPRAGRRGAGQPAGRGASGQGAQVFGTHSPEMSYYRANMPDYLTPSRCHHPLCSVQ